MVTIAVTGHAERTVTPERGTLTVAVNVQDDDRAAVVERATAAHAELVREADQLVASAVATRWTSDGVSAGIVTRWQQSRTGESRAERVMQATCSVRVRFTDFDALGRWATDVATRPDHTIGALVWELTDARRDTVMGDLRTTATRDAIAKAAVYATAAGLGQPRLMALFEDGLRPGAGGGLPVGHAAMRAFASDAGRGGGESFTLKPEAIELSVDITADFSTEAR